MNTALNIFLPNVIPEARCRVMEALTVVCYAVPHLHSDAACGLLNLMRWLDTRFEHYEVKGEQDFEELSANTCSVIAVLTQLNESFDHQMLYAARTVLDVAKQILDEACEKGGAA